MRDSATCHGIQQLPANADDHAYQDLNILQDELQSSRSTVMNGTHMHHPCMIKDLLNCIILTVQSCMYYTLVYRLLFVDIACHLQYLIT